MADRSPPVGLNIASFKQRNSAITEDLERQEVERENLWKRLQAARAEGDQLRALAQRSTDEDVSSASSSPRAIATIDEAPEEDAPTTVIAGGGTTAFCHTCSGRHAVSRCNAWSGASSRRMQPCENGRAADTVAAPMRTAS